jgi:GTPase
MSIDIALVGAPNAGKSSVMNAIIGRHLSAVSDKYSTTYDKITGLFTDINSNTQVIINDLPGATKPNNKIQSTLLMTKCWEVLEEVDLALFVVDSVKRLDFEVRKSAQRLKGIVIDH